MTRKRNICIWTLLMVLLLALTGCGLPGAQKDRSSGEITEEAVSPAETTASQEGTSSQEKMNSDQDELSTGQEEKTITADEEEIAKALIVDNETGSSKRMRKYLTKAGFDVTLVDSMDFEVEDYDTLVIPGGHNITPSIYGAERDEHTYGTDEEIDKLQIAAVQAFAEAEKPILGVCRGCQLVNVAFGGTINQHIPGWHKKNRRVKIERGSWLYYRLGTSESVYHYHHQCVEELGEGLVATMWDKKDGHIEGFEHETLPVYGIQWHPDSMGNRGIDVFRYYKEDILGMKTVKKYEKKD